MIKDAVFFTEKQGRYAEYNRKRPKFLLWNISKTDLNKKLFLDSAEVGEKNDIKKKEQGLRDLKPKCLLTHPSRIAGGQEKSGSLANGSILGVMEKLDWRLEV